MGSTFSETTFVVVLLVTLVTAQDCDTSEYSTFVADSTKCHYYTACISRIGTSLVCPSGYHFNAEKQMCDYPSRAGCIKCPATGFMNLAVDGSCHKFVQCFMGNPIDRECPPGLLFDPKFGQCNLKADVQCN